MARSPAIASSDEASQYVGLHRAHAATNIWDGRTGANDRVVLEALHQIATRARAVEIAASVREVGELSGVSSATAARCLVRLRASRWIRRVATADIAAGLPARYKLTYPPTTPHVVETSIPVVAASGHDAWRKLGRAAAQLHDALSDEPQTVRHLTAITGRSPSTVRRHLRSLEQDALARQLQLGAWIRQEADMDEIAEKYRWLGAAARQKEGHKAASARHHKRMEEHRKREHEEHVSPIAKKCDP